MGEAKLTEKERIPVADGFVTLRYREGTVYLGFERGPVQDSQGSPYQYVGPEAEISADKKWLYITTDPYEGAVMLNVETLPALAKIITKLAENYAAALRDQSGGE